jgi:Arm DNA-binding domain
MAKTGLLSPLRVGRETKPGRLSDGGGLYLQIKPTGSKSWLFRWKVDGKTRMMGLGPFPDVSLAAARDKATAMRALRHNGVDPHEAREAARLKQRLEVAQAITFRQCADTYISSHEAEWRTTSIGNSGATPSPTMPTPTLGGCRSVPSRRGWY